MEGLAGRRSPSPPRPLASWMDTGMRSGLLENVPLNNVLIPGSHDSGAYGFDRHSRLATDAPAALFKLHRVKQRIFGAKSKNNNSNNNNNNNNNINNTKKKQSSSSSSGRSSSSIEDSSLPFGRRLVRLCTTQRATVYEQLQLGIRYLDLRVCCCDNSHDRSNNNSSSPGETTEDLATATTRRLPSPPPPPPASSSSAAAATNSTSHNATTTTNNNNNNHNQHQSPSASSDFYLSHGLRGPSFYAVLMQIKRFLRESPSEVVILDMNHIHIDAQDRETHAALARLVHTTLGSLVCPPAPTAAEAEAEAEASGAVEAASSSATAAAAPAQTLGPETLFGEFVRHGRRAIVAYAHPLAIQFGFWPQHSVQSLWPNTNALKSLATHINTERLAPESSSLHVLQCIMTGQTPSIALYMAFGRRVSRCATLAHPTGLAKRAMPTVHYHVREALNRLKKEGATATSTNLRSAVTQRAGYMEGQPRVCIQNNQKHLTSAKTTTTTTPTTPTTTTTTTTTEAAHRTEQSVHVQYLHEAKEVAAATATAAAKVLEEEEVSIATRLNIFLFDFVEDPKLAPLLADIVATNWCRPGIEPSQLRTNV